MPEQTVQVSPLWESFSVQFLGNSELIITSRLQDIASCLESDSNLDSACKGFVSQTLQLVHTANVWGNSRSHISVYVKQLQLDNDLTSLITDVCTWTELGY